VIEALNLHQEDTLTDQEDKIETVKNQTSRFMRFTACCEMEPVPLNIARLKTEAGRLILILDKFVKVE